MQIENREYKVMLNHELFPGDDVVADFWMDVVELTYEVAKTAMRFFYAVQRLHWCDPMRKTKTQFAYDDVKS